MTVEFAPKTFSLNCCLPSDFKFNFLNGLGEIYDSWDPLSKSKRQFTPLIEATAACSRTLFEVSALTVHVIEELFWGANQGAMVKETFVVAKGEALGHLVVVMRT